MGDHTRPIVVVSHPRSGTHFCIDLIRRNFPVYNKKLFFWESSSKFYFNIDHLVEHPLEQIPMEIVQNFELYKSHRLGWSAIDSLELKRLASRSPFYIYPFRDCVATMRSYADFVGFEGSLTELLTVRDLYFGTSHSVQECFQNHGLMWERNNAYFLNMDDVRANPEQCVRLLSKYIQSAPIELRRRLPRKKRLWGKYAELAERVTGRESTEVQVRKSVRIDDESTLAEVRKIMRPFQEFLINASRRSMLSLDDLHASRQPADGYES